MPDSAGPHQPWRAFFDQMDEQIDDGLELHCIGGFVVIHLYGVARTTSDCDYVSLVPDLGASIAALGGPGSALHKRYKVYLDRVTVAAMPDSYEDRLIPLFPGRWQKIKLFALEAHDLALTKLGRNFERDRDDIQRLVAAGHLDREVLSTRYLEELRPYLSRPEPYDLTLRLWIEAYWPGPQNGA